MQIAETKGQFGFHFSAGDDECRPTVAFVQIYVKSSALSRAADLAVSPNLMTAAEIEQLLAAHRQSWQTATPSFTIAPSHDEKGSNAIILSPPDAVPLRFGDFAATVDQYLDEVRALSNETRARSEMLGKLIDAGAFRLAADPEHALQAPPREDAVPFLDLSPLENAVARWETRAEGSVATVVLSPAAASFDMFEDYAARGRAFIDAVGRLAAARGRTTGGAA